MRLFALKLFQLKSLHLLVPSDLVECFGLLFDQMLLYLLFFLLKPQLVFVKSLKLREVLANRSDLLELINELEYLGLFNTIQRDLIRGSLY